MSTQGDSLTALEESGSAAALRLYVHNLFKTTGEMPDWKLYDVGVNETYDRPTILARRNELAKAGIIGTMGRVARNPHSGKAGEVWGLVVEHGATPYAPDDKLSVRYMSTVVATKFPFGSLPQMTDESLGAHVRALINEAISEI